MKLWNDNLIKNLPDCYAKDKNSNNYKLLQLIQYDTDNFRNLLKDLSNSLDLEKATGYSLNLYGEMVGQSRGKANDEQYRILIKTKIARNKSSGSYKDIVNCICRILNCKPSEVLFLELDNKCAVKATKVPLKNIIGAGFTPNQFTQLLKSLLPAGVGFEGGNYEGTFEFSDKEGVMNNEKGFCQKEGDNYGGFLGVLSSTNTDTVLPI